MKKKPLLCPEALRQVPRQFSWIDQRLVRDGHIRGLSPRALALYLFLCTVADAQGMSYYSDATADALLMLGRAPLREARSELMSAALIAYRCPFYQVLSLEPGRGVATPAREPVSAAALAPPSKSCQVPAPGPRVGGVRSVGEILRSMMEERP